MSFPDGATLPHRLWAPPAHSLSSATADSSQLIEGKEGRSEEAEPRRCSEARRDEAVFSDDPPPWTGAGGGFQISGIFRISPNVHCEYKQSNKYLRDFAEGRAGVTGTH